MKFYILTGLQLIGFSMVGLCLFKGITTGDYDKLQLAQFVSEKLLLHGTRPDVVLSVLSNGLNDRLTAGSGAGSQRNP